MNRDYFRRMVDGGPLILGSTVVLGNNKNECPENWILEHSDHIKSMQRSYRDAGCDIICTLTSGANRYRLQAFGLASQTAQVNRELMLRCVDVQTGTIVFATCSTTGLSVEPFGDLTFEDAVRCFKEQGTSLAENGAAGFVIENMRCIQEARAALIALREIGDYPVIVHLILESDNRTAGETDALSALLTLQSLGADAVGFSTTLDNENLCAVISEIKQFAAIPLFAYPSAKGLAPDEYVASVKKLVDAGVNLIGGGDCVTTDHIGAIAGTIHRSAFIRPVVKSVSAVTSAKKTVLLGGNRPFAVVGERINPTGKKNLQANLREGSLDIVRQFALEQTMRRASILDINMGLSGIDEMSMMLRAVNLLSTVTHLPLCIDTTKPDVVEAALRCYPGRAIVNSVSGEKERIEQTLPVAARYGAMFIGLPLTDAGIPSTVKERINVVDTIMSAASSYGCTVDDMAVDGLVMTVSSNPSAAIDTLDLIKWCSGTLHSNTIVGLSNVSFGMPERHWINGAFLGMAMGCGLTMAISNPSSDGIMATVQAYNCLRGFDYEMLLEKGRYSEFAK
ncbi:MAG: dihydropteroate synthase [Fibrobacter sp.]|nr:dihydropteroate synthase [Fibrobacter sp.]